MSRIVFKRRSPTRGKSSEVQSQPSPSKNLPKTVCWSDLPAWMRDNEHILNGYRRELNSWYSCFASIFAYLHNETVNIHSHLAGAMLFIFFSATYDSWHFSGYESVRWPDYVVFSIFLASAVWCLGCSAFFHVSTAHSEKVAARCHAYDYSGIVVLIVGSFYPCIYYTFFCELHYQVFYLGTITVAGLGASYIVLNPEYAKPSHRGARTQVFIALGLCGIFPVWHGLVSHGFSKVCEELGFHWLLLSGALYITGALLYANRIPERFAPGKFDYFFASHQIFHFSVVAAALCHYTCILTAFNHWHSRTGVCIQVI
ncbi:hemolysin-III related-domain-containing protein [Amylostereum chailletii]|nr:hemolysin-III related-domain-containing protein [Amylostereum chailletii]